MNIFYHFIRHDAIVFTELITRSYSFLHCLTFKTKLLCMHLLNKLYFVLELLKKQTLYVIMIMNRYTYCKKGGDKCDYKRKNSFKNAFTLLIFL